MERTSDQIVAELERTPRPPTPLRPDRDYTLNDLALLIRRAELRIRLEIVESRLDLERLIKSRGLP